MKIPKDQRKKILLLCDDIRLHSGIGTMAREIVLNTCHIFNWVNLGAATQEREKNAIVDLSQDVQKNTGVEDAQVFVYPIVGYGDAGTVRELMKREKPDAIMIFTDPRYWIWLFQIENEIRKKIPLIYLNIWDDLPAPLYNKPYYESCDGLLAISRQTENINKLVLGDLAKDKVIKYTPHGIDHKKFYPIEEPTKEYLEFKEHIKKNFMEGKEYDFIVFYNSRNLQRKAPADVILGYREFCEKIGPAKAEKCALLMHTDPVDEHGTDLFAVRELLCDQPYHNVHFILEKFTPERMTYLYNMTDVTVLISSNEGWGLSITEAMMSGKMIIGNVTGGIQDQMRFEDDNGDWIKFDKDFCSNHFGKYFVHGKWAVAVWPSNMSIRGSLQTPYIFDDRVDFRDLAEAIKTVWEITPEERKERGLAGREWLLSDEARMSAQAMGETVSEAIQEVFEKFKPRETFEFIKTGPLPKNKLVHKLVY